jgi:hypothetical protein
MTQQVNWNRNLALAIALCALGSLAYWLEYKHAPEKEKAEESSKKVFAMKDNQVESIALSGNAKTFQLECQDLQSKMCKPGDNAKWKLTQPTQARADDSNANSLVSALSNLEAAETIDLKDETPEKRAALLKEYGLSPEALQGASVRKVDIKSPAAESIAYLGATNPINDNIFAVIEKVPAGQKASGKADETKVYQFPSYVKGYFDHDLSYWRDKKVLALASSEVQSFEIKSKKNGTISAERKDGGWIIKSGNSTFDGDNETIDNMLSAAAFLSAKSFVADSKSDPKAKAILKSNPEILSVTFHKAQGNAKEAPAPVVLTLYSKQKDSKSGSKASAKASPHGHDHEHEFDQGAAADAQPVYATVSSNDPLYELQPAAPKQFQRELKDFRLSKLMTSLERFSVKKLEFAGKPIGDKPLTLVNQDSKWLDDSSKAEVREDKVQTLLDRLTGNRIKDFLTGSAIPAGEKDGLKLTFGDDKNPAKHQYVFWKNGSNLYARDLVSAQKEAFLVDSTVTDALPWTRDFFKK